MIEGYEKLPNGVIKQTKIFNEIMTYDTDYIDTYERLGELGKQMAYLRLGYILGSLGHKPNTILDVGYGNGDFLRAVNGFGIESYGSDISGFPTPKGVEFVRWHEVFFRHYNVITFFDCLEHFEDISFVEDLSCHYIVISLPCCHYDSDEWFQNWKHRKPDEHLYHFNGESLTNFMSEMGYMPIRIGSPEDAIRKPVDNKTNILTGIFKKRFND